MTITLGGIDLNDNLYLDGIVNKKDIAVYQVRTIGGVSNLTTLPMGGGAPLTLSTSNNGALQGMFCQSQVDQIKILESQGIPVTLDYRDSGSFQVLIAGTAFKQFNQRQPVSPTKEYTGTINMIEA